MSKMCSPDSQLGDPFKRLYSNVIRSQQAKILENFEEYPRASSIQARHEYGILDPSGRINELRQRGHKITTNWISEPDSKGVLHRVGLYVYMGHARGRNHAK